MELKHRFQVSIASLILMTYGWYLGQLHQSGPDIAGIFIFITGAAGMILAFIIHYFTKKYPWHNQEFANILTGVVSCGIIFAFIVLLARLHG